MTRPRTRLNLTAVGVTTAQLARRQAAPRCASWRWEDRGLPVRSGPLIATMILLAYRHGFRAAELVDLRWDQIDFNRATLAVRRVKRGSPSTHPLHGDEMRALRKLQREQEPKSPFLFYVRAHPSPRQALRGL